MRRRIAVLAASGIVALGVGSVAVALLGLRPSPETADLDAPIPQDVMWVWITSCVNPGGGPTESVLIDLALDDDGVLTVELGEMTADGDGVVDAELTADANSCLSARSVDISQVRPASPAERALIYEWTRRWQAPCLAARGFGVTVQPRRDFLDPNDAPWYLLNSFDTSFLDLNTLLEARFACSPMPAFLEQQGVGW
jgi:hypothetical protein